jgi:hypothetical protein
MMGEVAARPAQAPVTGLAASALTPQGESEADWVNGFAWRSERCPSWQLFGVCGDLSEVPDPDTNVLAYHRPVGYRVRYECTTLSRRDDSDAEAVRRQADAILSHVAAHELWTGELTKSDPFDAAGETDRVNGHLASPDAETIAGGPYAMEQALGLLEENARRQAGGQQVVIHMPIRAVPLVGLRRVGNLLYTQTDALVIADSGYVGTGPAGEEPTSTTAWMYATGPVMLRRSTVEVIADQASTLNRATNRRTIWGQRVFAATFDPCTHFAIQVALPGATSTP